MSNPTERPSPIPADIQALSNDELIAEHRKLGAHISEQAKAFNEYCKPYRDRSDWIEKALFARLSEMNKGKPEGKRASISTEHGTAYLSTTMTPKVIDKIAFLDWILEKWDDRGAMLQIGAPQIAALRDFMDENDNAPPPNVEVSFFTNVNIRKS